MAESIIGRVFSRLTVLEKIGKNASGTKSLYRCRCRCGKYINVEHDRLTRGNTRSCGCLAIETRMVHGLRLQQRNYRNAIIADKLRLTEQWHGILEECDLQAEEWEMAERVRDRLFSVAEGMTDEYYTERGPAKKSMRKRLLTRLTAKCLLDGFIWKDILDSCGLGKDERQTMELVRHAVTDIAERQTKENFNICEIL